MWSVEYVQNDGESVLLARFSTFSAGLSFLEGHISTILDNMEESDNLRGEYETALEDIRDITRDPGVMEDPDQWEEEEFYVEEGHFSVSQF